MPHVVWSEKKPSWNTAVQNWRQYYIHANTKVRQEASDGWRERGPQTNFCGAKYEGLGLNKRARVGKEDNDVGGT